MALVYTGKQIYIDRLFTLQCCLPNQLGEIIEKENIGKSCHSDKINLLKANAYFYVLKDEVQYMRGGSFPSPIESVDDSFILINSCITLDNIEALLLQLKYYCGECCLETSMS